VGAPPGRRTASVRKGFSRRAHIRPRGGGSYSRGQDQSAFVGAPHRCERVSAGKPTFAPEAGAPTVGGQDQSAFVGAPPRCERVSAGKPTFAPGAGLLQSGAGSVCLCRSTASVRKGFSRQARIRPRGGGSYSRGQDQSAFVGAPPRCERVSADKPTFAPEAGAPAVGGRICLCRSTASVRKGFSRRARIRPRVGGSYNQAGICR